MCLFFLSSRELDETKDVFDVSFENNVRQSSLLEKYKDKKADLKGKRVKIHHLCMFSEGIRGEFVCVCFQIKTFQIK